MRALFVAASLLLTGLVGLAVTPSASAVGECVGEPGAVEVCQNLFQPAIRHCVTVTVGLQGASVCTDANGPEVCTSLNGRTCVPGSY